MYVVVVGQLQLFSDVLFPGRVEGYQGGVEVSAHNAFREVGGVEHLAIVVAFHPSAGSLYILAVVHKDIVDLALLVGNGLPVVEHSSPVHDSTKGDQFGERVEPPVGFPGDVAERVFDKPEEVFKSSLFVGFFDRFFAQSVLFEFPVILFSHRSIITDFYTCRLTRVFR